MLRIGRPRPAFLNLAVDSSPEAAAAPEILSVYSNPVMELGRLLREAANIEHALMVQYLFAAFSLKRDYDAVAGGTFDSASTLIGVAVQEMHHLARVNELLVAIGASPNLDRQDFPIRTDIYPFDLELEPLSRHSAAKYVTAEAPVDALDPSKAPTPEEKAFREAVSTEVGLNRVNHIGSLYGAIIQCLNSAIEVEPGLLTDSGRWIQQLEQIRGQGEQDHFHFFRSIFEATHPGFNGKDVWRDPDAAIYPSLPLRKNPTAFEGADATIPGDLPRQLAWLANLHYWTVLGLLNLGHSAAFTNLIGKAISHMINCLYPIGRTLSDSSIGLPFDALALNFGPGGDSVTSRLWLKRLVLELQSHEQLLGNNLPDEYSKSAAIMTLRELEAINGLQS
jgi:Ferritin-like